MLASLVTADLTERGTIRRKTNTLFILHTLTYQCETFRAYTTPTNSFTRNVNHHEAGTVCIAAHGSEILLTSLPDIYSLGVMPRGHDITRHTRVWNYLSLIIHPTTYTETSRNPLEK